MPGPIRAETRTAAMEMHVTTAKYDKDYLYQRAAAQLELAERTENPAAVAAHYTIAQTYLDLIGDEIVAEARAASDGLRRVSNYDEARPAA